MTTISKAKKTPPKFEDRVRFNWGYHDAAQAFREGWGVEKNFGFGPAIRILLPVDVLSQHPDGVYAEGWIRGYCDARDGKDTTSSESAWEEAEANGDVGNRFN